MWNDFSASNISRPTYNYYLIIANDFITVNDYVDVLRLSFKLIILCETAIIMFQWNVLLSRQHLLPHCEFVASAFVWKAWQTCSNKACFLLRKLKQPIGVPSVECQTDVFFRDGTVTLFLTFLLPVILGPYGISASLTGHSYQLNGVGVNKLVEDWKCFYPLHVVDDWTNVPEGIEHDVPVVVGVMVGDNFIKYPSHYVLVSLEDEVKSGEFVDMCLQLQNWRDYNVCNTFHTLP